ncbi:MAG: DUF5071 domain-containing protein [Defluviitaleaceae bacterium]|nr:DUF5071 domain-containing protein [Defluviitaleaceae bacterium]
MADELDLIPKDKFDLSTIDRLKMIDEERIEPLLSQLLEWIQDLNWPVAQPLFDDVLPKFHVRLIPHIKEVLNSNDDVWKYWVILMVKKFPKETVQCLSSEIKRIAEYPTAGEIAEEVNIRASEVIFVFNL